MSIHRMAPSSDPRIQCPCTYLPTSQKIPICPNCDSSTWCTLFPPLLMRVRGHPTSWRTTSWLNFVETDFVAELRGDRLRGCSDSVVIQLRGYLTWKPDFDFVKVGSVADDFLTSAGSCLWFSDFIYFTFF